MNIELLDEINALENAINKAKKEIVGRKLHGKPYRVFDIPTYEGGVCKDNITVKTLKKELNNLIEEYGENYENDKIIYSRLTGAQQDLEDIKIKLYEMKQLEKLLKERTELAKEEDSNIRRFGRVTAETITIIVIALLMTFLAFVTVL